MPGRRRIDHSSPLRAWALTALGLALAAGVVGAVVGLVVGLTTYAPTAWFAVAEGALLAGLPALLLGGVVGLVPAALVRRRRGAAA